MTNRLYYDNAYLTEFDARVLDCRPNGDNYDVLLDQSAFYPTSGGQPFDTGRLGGAHVLDVTAGTVEVLEAGEQFKDVPWRAAVTQK